MIIRNFGDRHNEVSSYDTSSSSIMEGPTEETEAFNPRESAINGSRNVLIGTRTTAFTRRKAAGPT
jgi:hypothetical protein